MVTFGNDWDELLAPEFEKDYYQQLRAFLKNEYSTKPVYPDMHSIFTALKLTSLADTKIVVIGQDPYHGAGQAHGLAFSVQPDVTVPPSLRNMYKELQTDVGFVPVPHGCLVKWARQGVLLLNTSLTVVDSQPNSHKGKGWEVFTDRIIELVNQKPEPVVFMLWGANAKAKEPLITHSAHLILSAPHPSPLSAARGFFGCRHFSKANVFLEMHGRGVIDWQLPPKEEL